MFTAGHLAMAFLGGAFCGVAAAAVEREIQARREIKARRKPPEA